MEIDSPAYALFFEHQRPSAESWPKHHRYEFECEAARGGTAIVWRAFDLQLSRYAAVKVLLGSCDTLQMRARLEREALISARLDHQGVVSVFDFDALHDGRPFIAMKWIDGDTLSALLDDNALSRQDRLPIFKRICEVLKHAHDRNVIHRDLKPANIFVDRYRQVHVVDWGLAKYIGDTEAHAELDGMPTINLNTCYGALMGTPAYMPPEQANGDSERINKRSDVFSLGCILFQLLTGQEVYSGRSHESMCDAAIAADLGPALKLLRSNRSRSALKRLAATCLSPDPAKRPADAGVILCKLERILAPRRFLNIIVTAFLVILGIYAVELIYVFFFGIVEIRYD